MVQKRCQHAGRSRRAMQQRRKRGRRSFVVVCDARAASELSPIAVVSVSRPCLPTVGLSPGSSVQSGCDSGTQELSPGLVRSQCNPQSSKPFLLYPLEYLFRGERLSPVHEAYHICPHLLPCHCLSSMFQFSLFLSRPNTDACHRSFPPQTTELWLSFRLHSITPSSLSRADQFVSS